MVQSCAEASPAKWHLAHTAWFFESFILREFLPGYKLFNADFPWLFNSYYRSFAQFPEKRLRSSFSRPGLDEVLGYRQPRGRRHRETARGRVPEPEVLKRIELGANHEEQHQELLLTDILHAFYTNPLRPAYLEADERIGSSRARRRRESAGVCGVCRWPGRCGIFGKRILLRQRAAAASCLAGALCAGRPPRDQWGVCGVYRRWRLPESELWLSAGWDAVEQNGWRAPLYWNQDGESWSAVYAARGGFAGRRSRPRQLATSATLRPMPMRAGPASACPPRSEWEVAAEGQRGGRQPAGYGTAQACAGGRRGRAALRRCGAIAGNGRRARISAIPDSSRWRARWANTTESS